MPGTLRVCGCSVGVLVVPLPLLRPSHQVETLGGRKGLEQPAAQDLPVFVGGQVKSMEADRSPGPALRAATIGISDGGALVAARPTAFVHVGATCNTDSRRACRELPECGTLRCGKSLHNLPEEHKSWIFLEALVS